MSEKTCSECREAPAIPKGVHVILCPRHAATDELLIACKAALQVFENRKLPVQYVDCHEKPVKTMLELAIAKLKETQK